MRATAEAVDSSKLAHGSRRTEAAGHGGSGGSGRGRGARLARRDSWEPGGFISRAWMSEEAMELGRWRGVGAWWRRSWFLRWGIEG